MSALTYFDRDNDDEDKAARSRHGDILRQLPIDLRRMILGNAPRAFKQYVERLRDEISRLYQRFALILRGVPTHNRDNRAPRARHADPIGLGLRQAWQLLSANVSPDRTAWQGTDYMNSLNSLERRMPQFYDIVRTGQKWSDRRPRRPDDIGRAPPEGRGLGRFAPGL